MKVIFLGTPDFAVASLQALINSNPEVVAVVTQPQKPTARGRKVKPTPVEQFAIKHNMPVYKFKNISKEGVSVLNEIEADVLAMCAYGQILSSQVLTLKKYGVINVHGSVLPKYRGASPIQWTIISGEKTAGISILKSDVGIDDGAVLSTLETDVLENETAVELFERLSHLGANLLVETLNQIENGTAVYTPQNHDLATHCKKLTKDMSKIDLTQNAQDVVNLINGINQWPVASFTTPNGNLKVYKATIANRNRLNSLGIISVDNYKIGEIVVASPRHGLIIRGQDDFINLETVQAENAKIMPAKSYLNGNSLPVGEVVF